MNSQICTKCNGAGEITRAIANMTPDGFIEWTRGKSLTPLTTAHQH